ncbi:unnamed protein product [Leptosia nina]|uniref:Uncharacterized protein n=1 Tax=Leptosia nina TaxID=320188 RepID=A0AAV1JR14_9NEOP
MQENHLKTSRSCKSVTLAPIVRYKSGLVPPSMNKNEDRTTTQVTNVCSTLKLHAGCARSSVFVIELAFA